MTKSEIQLIKSLGDKRERTQMGLFVAEGDKLIDELIASELNVRGVYTTHEDLTLLPQAQRISNNEMSRISQLKSHSTSLAIVEIPQRELVVASLEGQLTLCLDGVQNPGNLGTIIRLADWFGIKHIVCSPTCADCFNPKVVQATMGAIIRVEIHYAPLEPILTQAQQLEIPIYGTLLDGDNIYNRELGQNGIIVMGSEGQGISPQIEAFVTSKLYIPSYPADQNSSESLNVAVATAIVCAEFRRRG